MTDQNLQDVYTLQIRRHANSAPPSPYCEACKNGFLHVNSLQVRQFTQTGKLPGVCRACNAAFMRICRLQIRHLNTNDHQPHVCEICSKTFTHAGNYKKHKSLHEQGALKSDKKSIPEPPYYCTKEDCGRVFMKYGSFVKHVKNHDALEQWRCGECTRVFNAKPELTQHLENNVCNLCNEAFKCSAQVRKHKLMCKVVREEQTNEEIKKEVATKMDAINDVITECTPEQTVQVHEENGKKIFTYRCSYCSKIFKRWGALRKHVYIHDDGGRKYTCATCLHTFNCEMLKIHVPHCTELSTPYVCKMCKKRFPVVDELEQHLLEHVEENRAAINQKNQEQSQTASEDSQEQFPTTSDTNETTVERVTSLNATTRPIIFRLSVQESPKTSAVIENEQQEELELCEEDEDFIRDAIEDENIEEGDQFVEERQQVVEKDLEVQSNEEVSADKYKHFCSVCEKGFVNLGALKNHFSVHTGDVAYECNICQKRFTDSAKMKKHALIHKKRSLRKKVEEKVLTKSKYPCKRCPRGFKTLGALRVHTASHRRGKK